MVDGLNSSELSRVVWLHDLIEESLQTFLQSLHLPRFPPLPSLSLQSIGQSVGLGSDEVPLLEGVEDAGHEVGYFCWGGMIVVGVSFQWGSDFKIF